VMTAMMAEKVFGQAITHTVPSQPLYYGAVVNSLDIDVNGDGTPDFKLLMDGAEVDLAPLADNVLIAVPEPPPDLGSWVAPLNGGTTISSSLNPEFIWYGTNSDQFGSALIVACVNIGCLGFFQNGTDAYAGIRLDTDGTFRYGWIHIQSFGLNFGQISDWAYETAPNTPILAGAGIDSDHDGVPDYLDQCPNTAPGAIVDANGCSIDQLCRCDAPWKNHGQYVNAVKSVADQFRTEGRITKAEQKAIVARAAQSNCGKAK